MHCQYHKSTTLSTTNDSPPPYEPREVTVAPSHERISLSTSIRPAQQSRFLTSLRTRLVPEIYHRYTGEELLTMDDVGGRELARLVNFARSPEQLLSDVRGRLNDLDHRYIFLVVILGFVLPIYRIRSGCKKFHQRRHNESRRVPCTGDECIEREIVPAGVLVLQWSAIQLVMRAAVY